MTHQATTHSCCGTTASSNESDLTRCIKECVDCHSTCLSTIQHCLNQGGKHAESEHIHLLLDCVEICQTSANFMLRGSQLHALTCRSCSEVCQRCAQDCERMADDETMRHCAEACRRCGESCEQMAGAAH